MFKLLFNFAEPTRSGMEPLPFLLFTCCALAIPLVVAWTFDEISKKRTDSGESGSGINAARREQHLMYGSPSNRTSFANCYVSSAKSTDAQVQQQPQLSVENKTVGRFITMHKPTLQALKQKILIDGGSVRAIKGQPLGNHAQRQNISMHNGCARPRKEQMIEHRFQSTIFDDSRNLTKTHEIIGHTALCLVLFLQALPGNPSPRELDKARQKLYAWKSLPSKVEIGRGIANDSKLRELLHRSIGYEMLKQIRDYCNHEGRKLKKSAKANLQESVSSGDKRFRDAMVGDKALDLILYIEGQCLGLDRRQLELARQELFSNLNLGGRSQATNIEAMVGVQIIARFGEITRSLQKHIDKITMKIVMLSINRCKKFVRSDCKGINCLPNVSLGLVS